MLDQHDAYSDALMTAMTCLTLQDLKARHVHIPGFRAKPVAWRGGTRAATSSALTTGADFRALGNSNLRQKI